MTHFPTDLLVRQGGLHRATTGAGLLAGVLALACIGTASAQSRPATGKPATAAPSATAAALPATAPAAPDPTGVAEIAPAMSLVVGKSTLIRLSAPISRISVGNPAVADVTLINNRELYLLGKNFGSTNVMMWRRDGGTTIVDVSVSVDAKAVSQRIAMLLPGEKGIAVQASADSIVLSGVASSAAASDQAVQIAETYLGTHARGMTAPVKAGQGTADAGQTLQIGQAQATSGRLEYQARVVNLMSIAQPQQVMLEVKVAEISKTLLDKLGAGLNGSRTDGSWRYGIINSLLSNSAGLLTAANASTAISVDAESRNGLVKILAEPNIVSISGQEASFLAGGKIFIPVARNNSALGVPTITLEEKEFGVGLKFTPTVIDNGRINLRVAPEVSELAQNGSPFTTDNGVTSVLPSFTTRRAQTTVQLGDGQSFAIAGLIKNNVSSTIKKFPLLGELPILGTLFRSTEFQSDRTELLFIVTPRLVKPVNGDIALPTDGFRAPSRAESLLDGRLEGSGRGNVPADRPAPIRPSAQAGSAAGPFILQ